jgi:predicted secreted Zn-dependent protease
MLRSLKMPGHYTQNKNKGINSGPELCSSLAKQQPFTDRNPPSESEMLLGTEVPFHPESEKHLDLLNNARTKNTISDIMLGLQRTYGNTYVQRLVEEMGTRSRQVESMSLEDDSKVSVVSKTGMAGIVQRTPAGGSKGTISIQQPAPSYYDVEGNTLEEVGTAMGTEEWGQCQWDWSQTSYRTTNDTVDRVNIVLILTITLPRWTGDGWRRASPAAKAEWNRMLAALRTHENGHADIARSFVHQVQEHPLNHPESEFQTLFTEGQNPHEDRQRAYDAETSHGETQGVSLDTSIDQPPETSETSTETEETPEETE